MKPVRLLKRLGAAIAAGLLALGLVAGTASGASASQDTVASPASSGELQ